MSKPKFSGYPSSKPQYYRELWNNGPIMVEARRLARQELWKQYRDKGVEYQLQNLSEKAIEKLVTVLLYNSEAVFLQRAKWNLKVD